MTVKDLQDLFEYNYWANNKLLDVAVQLTPEQFVQSVAGSYGSVRNTLVHALSAEWGWMARCGGTARGPMLKAEDYPTLGSLRDQWGKVETWMRELLSTLDDSDVDRIVEFTIGNGPPYAMAIGELLQHASVHGIHHRGQVALLLRLLGYTPGNFDILFYYGGKRGLSVP